MLFLFIYWWFAETNAWVPGGIYELGDVLGAVSVGLPLLMCVIGGLVVIRLGWLRKNEYVHVDAASAAVRLFRRGLLLSTLGATSWILTETLCDSVVWIRWFPGHFLWHTAMAYGLTCCLLLGAILRADNERKNPRLWRPTGYRGRNVFVRAYFAGPHMVHCHTAHLPLGALLTWCTMCGTGCGLSTCAR